MLLAERESWNGPTISRRRARLYSGLGDFQSGVLKLASLPISPVFASNLVHRDPSYTAIFITKYLSLKWGTVYTIRIRASTCRFHNPRDRSIRSGVILLFRGRFDACVREIRSRVVTRSMLRVISRWMCNSIYKSAYGNGEIKSLSGFRILISRFAVAVPSITFVGNFHVNIVVYFLICMIHCSVTMTCKNKIFILRSCVSIAFHIWHTRIMCFLHYNSKKRNIE